MLTDRVIGQAKPASKPKKLADAKSLYLIVRPDGARWWRWDYRYGGKRKTLSFGVYPEVTLAEARERRDASRRLLRDGRDPSVVRRESRQQDAIVAAGALTFREVMASWRRDRGVALTAKTKKKHTSLIDNYITGTLGPKLLRQVDAPTVLAVIQPIARAGRHETAAGVKRLIGQVLRYAVAHGLADRDCTQDLRGALTRVNATHHAAVTTPADVGGLLRAIHADQSGSIIVSTALRFLPLVFVRPEELRIAEWSQVDWKHQLWRIPKESMKGGRAGHLVPLSSQAIALLRELQPYTGASRYIFPALRSALRPMSNGTLSAALARIGYDSSRQTPHGFRTIASTLMNERGWNRDHIEMQLAHVEPGVRGVYNQAKYLTPRAAMMQAWADYLDTLRAKA